MRPGDEPLPPNDKKQIDDWIELMLHSSPDQSDDPPSLPDSHLLQELQALCQEQAQAVNDRVERVWQRLEGHVGLSQHGQRQELSPARPSFQPERASPMQKPMLLHRATRRWPPRLGALAAAVLLVALVGGLITGLILVRHPGNGTPGGPKNQTTATSTAHAPATSSPTTPPPPPVSNGGAAGTIHMVDAATGWAQWVGVKAWRILHTTNGGFHWQDVTPPSVPAVGGELPAYFLNGSVAWVVPLANATNLLTVFRTTNGGQTWQQEATLTHIPDVGQLTFINAQDGWLLNTQGAAGNEVANLYRTTDGGASWTEVSSTGNPPTQPGTIPFNGTVKRISFLNASTGWMTALSDQTNDVWFYVTHDGGATWHQQSLLLPSGLTPGQVVPNPPTFFDSQNGSMLVGFEQPGFEPGASYLYATHDGGATWQVTIRLPVDPSNLIDPSPDFITVNQGWTSDGSTLYMTSDGGQRWVKVQASSAFNNILELNFVSPAVGWAMSFPTTGFATEFTLNGASGAVSRPTSPDHSGTLLLIKTVDGGQTWQIANPMLV